MKTQIIQLDEHDDVISVRDKMSWGQTGRILLVWPKHVSGILDNELDLVLLIRHATDLNAQLAIITKDPRVIFNAKRLGIPVFQDTHTAHEGRWSQRRRRRRFITKAILGYGIEGKPVVNLLDLKAQLNPPPPKWVSFSIFRFASFAVGVMSVLVLGIIIFPQANIRLAPQRNTQEILLTAYTNDKISAVNPSGALPLRTLTIVVEGRQSTKTNGTISLPNQKASGKVRFTNLTDQAVVIPKETFIRTATNPPIRFATTQPNRISPGAGQMITVTVTALNPGMDGNIKAGEIQTIEGILGLQLTAENTGDFSGGTNRSAAAPTEQDRKRLYSDLLTTLQETAILELQEKLTPGDLILSQPALVEVLEESYFPLDNVPADLLELSLRLEFQASYISNNDQEFLAQTVAESTVPLGFTALPGTLVFSNQSPPVSDGNGSASWELKIVHQITPNLDPQETALMVSGLPTEKALEYLAEQIPLENPPQINLTPSWWPRLPLLPFRIEVLPQKP